VWDLRTAGKCRVQEVGGAVTGLEYDSSGGMEERLLYCTAKGIVGAVLSNGWKVLYEELQASVQALCVRTAGAASQVFAATEQEGLLYMANPL